MALESELDGADPDFEPEVVSAFGEAFNNVAVHGYRDADPEPVQIEVGWDSDRLVITMIDSGRTFDPSTIAPPNLDDLPENGMGLFIMRSCMDEVDYRPGPPNTLRLVKLRRRRDSLLPPEPTDSGVGLARELALEIEGLVGDAPTSSQARGDRSSHVSVVHAPNVGERTGDSGFRMTAVRPDQQKEISRRR